MSLQVSHFVFDGPLPDLDEVRAEVHRRLGSTNGIERLVISGRTVEARSMLDPFTHAYVCAVLTERGGRSSAKIPDWAHHPLRDLDWRTRLSIRWSYWRR